ncbi:MAG: hypothetical protein ABI988_18300 [Nitrospirota bacterium]
MSLLAAKNLPPPSSDEAFEELCLDVWKRLLNDPSAQRYGRPGQKQHGVDIIGRRRGSLDWIGVQCKLRRMGNVSHQDIGKDIDAALRMNPRLADFVIATTGRRDTSLQDFARQRTEEHLGRGLFSVRPFFWDDFEEFLQDEPNFDILARHYDDLMVEVLPHGLAVAKMLSLKMGVEKPTTLYELLIGRTLARGQNDGAFGLAYFKDLAYMVNLQTRTAALFRLPIRHHSDLETAILNRTDEYLIASWLNTFDSIDTLLRLDAEEHTLTISVEEF